MAKVSSNCERFEPRSHFKRLSLIVRVNLVLNRTVVVDSDWRFDNLCGSHLQSHLQSFWLWRWVPHRLSKRQSLSTTTVLFRTTFTRTIKLNLLSLLTVARVSRLFTVVKIRLLAVGLGLDTNIRIIFKDIYKILRYCQRRREKLPLRLGKGFKCACLPVLFGTMSLWIVLYKIIVSTLGTRCL